MATALALAIIAVLAVLFVIMIVSSLIVICPPNKVAVISGRAHPVGWPNGRLSHSQGRPHASNPDPGEGLLDGPQQHSARGVGAQRLLEGRHPPELAGHRQREGVEPGGAALQLGRALPQRPSPVDRPDREGDARGEPSWCARNADAGRGQRGSAEVLAGADRRGRRGHQDARSRARCAQDPERDRRQPVPRLGRPSTTAEVVKQARVAEAERMAESEAAEAAARERAQIATCRPTRTSSRSRTSSVSALRSSKRLPRPRRRRRPSPATLRVPPPSRSSSSSASSWSVAASRPMSSRPPRPTSKPSSSPLRRRRRRSSRTARRRSRCSSVSRSSTRLLVMTASASSCSTCSRSSSTRSCRRSTMSISIGSPSSTMAVVRRGDSRPRVAAAGCGRLAHRADRGGDRCRHSRLDAQRPSGIGAGFGTSTTTAGTGSLTSRPAAA